MEFIPGDIVRYKGKTDEYLVIINTAGKLQIKPIRHGGKYILGTNATVHMEIIGIDRDYVPAKESIEAFRRRNKAEDCSPRMRARIEKAFRMAYMDMSGFDALKSAGNNDAIMMIRHGKHYDMGVEKMQDILNRVNNKEDKMSISINSLVAKVTDNIKDAQLVTQYFGYELSESSIKDEFFVRDNYEDLLKEAKAREEKRLANLNNA